MELTKIAVSGGARGVRAAALQRAAAYVAGLGYAVLCIPNAAATLGTSGLTPEKLRSETGFSAACLRLQRELERIYTENAAGLRSDRAILLCDGGTMEVLAGLDPEQRREALREADGEEIPLRDSYDAVYLLEAGEGAPNASCVAAWVGTPHLRVARGADELIRQIGFFLGDPEPLEIERKFLIEYPDLDALERLPNCRRVDIAQTYLRDRPGVTARVRRRGEAGSYLYYHTAKVHITDARHVELERQIDRAEYEACLSEADPLRGEIRKSRYCLLDDDQYFELDVFPFWKHQAVLEIELEDENAAVRLPEAFRVIREVTTEPAFKNSVLALRLAGGNGEGDERK